MPDGGEREAFVAADYNAEMVEHVARPPEIRDRAIFVGNPDDIVPERLGPDLPLIRDWTERNFDFAGYVDGLRPEPSCAIGSGCAQSSATRRDEQVCIVTVGGSGVGAQPAAARDRRLPGRQAARARTCA